MNNSILLPIAGSRNSLFAMEAAWRLAEQTGSVVDAQHVIDSVGALEFVGLQQAGMVGSGPYLNAFEHLRDGLREIGRLVVETYTTRAEGKRLSGESFLDEGDRVEEICRRAAEHSLVVMGHRRRQPTEKLHCHPDRLSLAETLAHCSSVPLLIVENQVAKVEELVLVCSMDHINAVWMKNCLAAAKALKAECSLTFLASGAREEQPMDFLQDLRRANPEFADLPVRLVTRSSGVAGQLCQHHLRVGSPERSVIAVIPTIHRGDQRVTSYGECPSDLLRRLTFDAMLFWPEEYTTPLFSVNAQAATAS